MGDVLLFGAERCSVPFPPHTHWKGLWPFPQKLGSLPLLEAHSPAALPSWDARPPREYPAHGSSEI